MLNQHRFSSLGRHEQRRFSSLNEVYDQIMKNFDKQSQRIRHKFSNPTFDDSFIVRPRNTLPKLELQALRQKEKLQRQRKNRMKFYSNKIVVNQFVYISERRQNNSKQLQQVQFRKINMPHPHPNNNNNANGQKQLGGVLSERNKRIMQLYKRAEKDSQQYINKIRFTKPIQNPNRSKMIEIQEEDRNEQETITVKKNDKKQDLGSNQKRMIDILKQAKQKRKKVQLPYMKPQRSKSNIIINSYAHDHDNFEKNTIQCKKLLQIQGTQTQNKIKQQSQTKQISHQEKEREKSKQNPRVKTMKRIKYEPKKDFQPIKRRFNWKLQPLPSQLQKIQKQQFYKLLRYYINVGQIQPIQSGFYKAYIGPGNNNPLIKKLLKQRGHWIIVQSIQQEPHFVWTQIKHGKFNQMLTTPNQKQYEQVIRNFNNIFDNGSNHKNNNNQMNENDNMSDKDKKEQGGDRNNNEGENMHSNTIYNIKALQRTQNLKSQLKLNQIPTANLGSDRQNGMYGSILHVNTNYKTSIHQQLQTFIKMKRNQYINGCEKILLPTHFHKLMHQIKNRFKNGNNVTYFSRIKQVFIDYIQEYAVKKAYCPTKNGQNYSNSSDANGHTVKSACNNYYNSGLEELKANQIRLHNHIDNSGAIGDKKGLLTMMTKFCQLFDEDVDSFIPTTIHVQSSQNYKQIFKAIPDGPWILKPGQATNRGTGITIHTSQDTLISQLNKKKKHKNGYKFTHIVQKYIDPLLYNGRKFDIRVWCLWSGRKLWWYREGYLRTSSKQFTLKNLNKFIHLTNDAIQSQSQQFGKFEPANKLSFNQFQKYLQSQYNYYGFQTCMLEQMKKLAIKAFRMGNLLFNPNNRQHNFELFGLDFLIDNKFKPWLIQCNTNPCLQINCSLLARLVPNMLQNVMNLTVDMYFPVPAKKRTKQNERWSSQLFKFELIYDGVNDVQMKQQLLVKEVEVQYKQQYDSEDMMEQYKYRKGGKDDQEKYVNNPEENRQYVGNKSSEIGKDRDPIDG